MIVTKKFAKLAADLKIAYFRLYIVEITQDLTVVSVLIKPFM